MKSLTKLVLGLYLLALISFSPRSITANELLSNPDQVLMNQVQNDFNNLYNSFEHLDNYQITVTFYNLDANKKISRNTLITDRQTGDSHFQMTLYKEDAEGKVHEVNFDLLSYRYFDMVYINFPHLLKSSRFFDQAYFSQETARALAGYRDYYTAINPSDLRLNLTDSLLNSVAFLPDLDQIANIDANHIYRIGQRTMIDIERLEIPRDLFNKSGRFHFNYQADVEIVPAKDAHKFYDVTSNHSVAINQNNNGISLELDLDSDITTELLPTAYIPTVDGDNYSIQEIIKSSHVTDKLTKATITIDPDKQLYRAVLTGLFEEVSLNIFTTEPAGFESYNHRMVIEVSPTEATLPHPQSLNKMTLDEFNYVLEDLLNQPYIESPLMD